MQKRRKILTSQFQRANSKEQQYTDRLPIISRRKMSQKQSPIKQQNLNKYYIHPNLRYKIKSKNPKDNPESYTDETFIYKNLHKQSFWNWAHPLEEMKMKASPNQISSKLNRQALENFKLYVDNRPNVRLPNLVKEILNRQL